MNFQVLILFCKFWLQCEASSFKILDFLYTYNPAYLNMTLNLKEADDGMIFNEHSEYLKDLPDPIIRVTLLQTSGAKDGNYETRFDYSFNACKIMSSLSANFVLKVFFENYEKSSSRKLSCPYTKGLREIKDLKLSTNFIPSILIINRRFEVRIKTFGKIAQQKRLIFLYNIKFVGEIKT